MGSTQIAFSCHHLRKTGRVHCCCSNLYSSPLSRFDWYPAEIGRWFKVHISTKYAHISAVDNEHWWVTLWKESVPDDVFDRYSYHGLTGADFKFLNNQPHGMINSFCTRVAQKWLTFLGDLPPKKVSRFWATRVSRRLKSLTSHTLGFC